MNAEQRQYLVALGLAPAAAPPALYRPFNVYPNAEEVENQVWPVEGDLGRMLTWQDLVDDGYHLHKFMTGRSFKTRSYYQNKLVEFYERIFLAYPEELRSGMVAYDPNIHNRQTNYYEGQLRFLERMIAEENQG